MAAPLLTLRPLDPERCAWVLDTDGRLSSGTSSWTRLPRPTPPARIRLLLPGDWVSHASVSIAARNPRLISQALPYALEEQLAEDIERLRIVHGARDADGRVPARIVRRQALDELLARLRAEGLQPDGVYSELDALPDPAEGWNTLALPDLVLARGPKGLAMAMEPALLAAALGGSGTQAIEAAEGPWIWLHRHLDERGAIDVLGGGGRASGTLERLRPWRIPAAIAASALLLQGGLMVLETMQLNHQRTVMQADIERMAREAAPEVKRWINPLAQLRQMASGTGVPAASQAGMLELLAKAAPVLAAQPGIKLGNLRYQGHTLDAQLGAADGATLESLLKTLKQESGMQAELAEQRVEGAEAQARLRLKGAKG